MKRPRAPLTPLPAREAMGVRGTAQKRMKRDEKTLDDADDVIHGLWLLPVFQKPLRAVSRKLLNLYGGKREVRVFRNQMFSARILGAKSGSSWLPEVRMSRMNLNSEPMPLKYLRSRNQFR